MAALLAAMLGASQAQAYEAWKCYKKRNSSTPEFAAWVIPGQPEDNRPIEAVIHWNGKRMFGFFSPSDCGPTTQAKPWDWECAHFYSFGNKVRKDSEIREFSILILEEKPPLSFLMTNFLDREQAALHRHVEKNGKVKIKSTFWPEQKFSVCKRFSSADWKNVLKR